MISFACVLDSRPAQAGIGASSGAPFWSIACRIARKISALSP